MSLAQTIYRMAPIPAKALLLNIKAASNSRKRYRHPYAELLDRHKQLWYADLDVVEKYQRDRLGELLLEAYDYSPWYQHRFRERGMSREAVVAEPFEVLGQMPYLTKRHRKVNLDNLLSRNRARKIVDVGFTSGSTGEPMRVPRDQWAVPRTFALLDRYYWSIGLPQRKRTVRLTGRQIINTETAQPPFWFYNVFERQLLVSAFHLGSSHLPAIVRKLDRFKAHLVEGYPSALYEVARFMVDNGLSLSSPPVAVSSTAETLFPHQRDAIEKAFDCKIYNQYASADGSPFITECHAGKMHLNLDTGVFEFLDTEGVAMPLNGGQIAELVVTSFRNFAVPLVRYRIGDMVQLAPDSTRCSCGCEMPFVKSVLGRDNDLILAANGALVGLGSRVFTGVEGIVRGQIIQIGPSELVLRYVADLSHNQNTRKALIEKAQSLFGREMSVQVDVVSELPLGPNGKFRPVMRTFDLPSHA